MSHVMIAARSHIHVMAQPAPEKQVEELYLVALSRMPTGPELARDAARLTAAKDRQSAAEDLLWALMNTKEFLFNH